MEGKEIDVSTVQKAVANGIAYVTEDRKSLGLVLSEDIKNNVTLANLPGIAWRGVIDKHRENRIAQQYRSLLKIRSSGSFKRRSISRARRRSIRGDGSSSTRPGPKPK